MPKDTLMTCKLCGKDTPMHVTTQRYCPDCRKVVKRRDSAISKKRVLERNRVPRILTCEDCFAIVPKTGNYQKVCKPCYLKRVRQFGNINLKKYRLKTKDVRNQAKKDRLAANPKIYVCPECGKTGRKMGTRVHCSDECAKLYNARWTSAHFVPKIGRLGGEKDCLLCGEPMVITAINKIYCPSCIPIIDCNRVRRYNLSKRSSGGTHSRMDFNKLGELMKWKCEYCGIQLDKKTATEDHIIPIASGGDDSIFNIAVACRSCNCSKGKQPVDLFIDRRSSNALRGVAA
jgi:5-methylcytosine-specific restriction endonuclease McrA